MQHLSPPRKRCSTVFRLPDPPCSFMHSVCPAVAEVGAASFRRPNQPTNPLTPGAFLSPFHNSTNQTNAWGGGLRGLSKASMACAAAMARVAATRDGRVTSAAYSTWSRPPRSPGRTSTPSPTLRSLTTPARGEGSRSRARTESECPVSTSLPVVPAVKSAYTDGAGTPNSNPSLHRQTGYTWPLPRV